LSKGGFLYQAYSAGMLSIMPREKTAIVGSGNYWLTAVDIDFLNVLVE
jgi:hypothetical protein